MKPTLEQYLIQYHTTESVKSYLYNIRHFVAMNPKANQYTYKDIVAYMDRNSQYYPNEVTRGTQLSAIKNTMIFYLLQLKGKTILVEVYM